MAKASVTATRRVRYDEDLYAWTQEQAALLRARQFDALDCENLAEEIAAVGGTDRRKLESRLCVVMPDLIRDAYPDAVRDAVDEIGLPAENFANVCPCTPDAVLDEDHLPDASF